MTEETKDRLLDLIKNDEEMQDCKSKKTRIIKLQYLV